MLVMMISSFRRIQKDGRVWWIACSPPKPLVPLLYVLPSAYSLLSQIMSSGVSSSL
jgi:hypothetical protein